MNSSSIDTIVNGVMIVMVLVCLWIGWLIVTAFRR